MKRPITNLVIGWLAFVLSAFQVNAQTITFSVDPQSVNGSPGDQITVDIAVSGFTNVLSFQYSMGWDPAIIQFVPPVGNVTSQLPGYTAGASFGINNANMGILTTSWLDPDVTGVSLPDNTVLYSLTFEVLSSDGTDISFTGVPTIIEVVDGMGNAINFVGVDGIVNGGGSGGSGATMTVKAPNVSAANGSNICLDVTVQDFDNIVSMEYSMDFDPAVLQFTGVQGLNLPGLVMANIGTSGAGSGDLTMMWSDPNNAGVTVADNTVIYQVCFDVVGTAGQSSGFVFDGSPTAIEVLDGNGDAVTLTPVNGNVSVSGGGNNGTDLIVAAPTVSAAIGSNICLEITVQNFNNILSMQYSMHFDPAVLQFTGVQGLNLPGFVNANIGTNNAGSGDLTISWSDPNVTGVTVADNTVIYQVCFDVIGSSGQSSSFTFDGMPTPVEVVDGSGNAVVFAPVSGMVTANGGNGGGGNTTDLIVNAPNVTAEAGTNICLDFTVQNFNNILSMQYSMHFDPAVLQFTGVQGLNLPGFVVANIGTNNAGSGTLTLSWSDPNVTGVTVANNTVIYQACFDVVGASGQSSSFTFDGTPTPIEVVDGNGQPVTFLPSSGSVNVEGGIAVPTDLTFTASSETSPAGTQLCVDMTVDLFQCVISTQFSMHFDPAILEFDTIVNLNLPDLTLGGSFGTVLASNGTITFSWSDPNTTGVTLANGTRIFTVCFNVIGTTGQNSSFFIDGSPTSIEVTDCNPDPVAPVFVPGTQTVGNPCPGPVSITNALPTDILCFGDAVGAVDISVAGGNNSYTFEWKNAGGTVVSTNEDLTGALAGTYTVVVTSCNGTTSATDTYTINQPASAINITGTTTPVACFGESSGNVNMTVSGGTANSCNAPGYMYVWSNGATTEDLTGIAAGAYTVTVTDCNNCQATSTFNVTGSTSLLTVTISPTEVSCFGGSDGQILASGNGGVGPYEYSMNGSTFQNSGTFNNLTPGNYTIRVRDAFGCVRSTTAMVGSPSAMQLSTTATDDLVNCNGTVDLTVLGGTSPYTYLWNNGETTEDVSGLCAGEYCVTVTDSRGCTSEICQTVQATLSIESSQITPTCFGQCTGQISVTISGGQPNYTYAWSNGMSGPSISGVCAGSITLTLTSGDGQQAVETFMVEEAAAPVSISDSDIQLLSLPNASDGSVSVTAAGGFPGYTYLWNNNQTGSTAVNLPAGEYFVTVTDQFGCSAVGGPYNIFFPPNPMDLVVEEDVICASDTDGGTLKVTVTGGITPYSFTFAGPDNIDPINDNEDGSVIINGLSPGTYSVTVTDAGPGTFQQTLNSTVSIDEIIMDITPITITPVTNGSNGKIDIVPTGGTPPYQYQWSHAFIGQNPFDLQPGDYDLTLIDANGCLQQFFDIPVEEFVTDSVKTENACPDDANGSITVLPSGSQNTPFTYNWSNGATTQTVSGLSVGDYTVTITDTLGVSIEETFSIGSVSQLTAEASQVGEILCSGDNTGGATVEASNGMPPFDYLWNNGMTSQSITGVPAGNYIVTVLDAAGCEFSDNVEITQPPKLTVMVSTDNGADCSEGNGRATALAIGGTPTYTYQWDDPLSQIAKTAILLQPGAINVTVTDANGCEESKGAVIDEITPLVVEGIGVPDTGGPDGQAIANVTSGTWPYEFEWSGEIETDSILSELLPGFYTVKVSDSNGCEELLTIKVDDLTVCLQASAVITPEGDGFNEEFHIGCLSRYSDNRLEIFNRWGQLVFLANDYNDDRLWRGTNRRGNDVPDGVYFYVFEYKDPVNNTTETLKGAVTVLRK
ncbi:MAG TPA: T9SS type B sorting domain-containing protein [Bacteroidetes bacterium]|nr:T9SS type B sorting domain-containing protein [Bacteroidota bacterium]